MKRKMYLIVKRFFDIILSFIALVILSPLFLILAILIKLESKGSVFFKQKRVSKNKKYFNILKFRTMRTDAPKDMPTASLKNAESYITKIGVGLRKNSIDELPQLINILKGEMSIIGPRPALWNQYELLEQRDKYGANGIRPGLTGWAQVNGRDELSNVKKATYDGEYAKKMSFGFDIKIFFKTIVNVLKHDGIVEGAVATLDEEKEKVS